MRGLRLPLALFALTVAGGLANRFGPGLVPSRASRASRAPHPPPVVVDGDLAVDPAGRFVPGPGARRLFDRLLAAATARDDAARDRVVSEIERRLDGEAAREATALLDRYLRYRERAQALGADGRAALLALREETLGEDAGALFADEDTRDVAAGRLAPLLAPPRAAGR
jgi:lipase chaperone LimK